MAGSKGHPSSVSQPACSSPPCSLCWAPLSVENHVSSLPQDSHTSVSSLSFCNALPSTETCLRGPPSTATSLETLPHAVANPPSSIFLFPQHKLTPSFPLFLFSVFIHGGGPSVSDLRLPFSRLQQQMVHPTCSTNTALME